MTEIWSNFRPPTNDEKDWLYFVYGPKEADRLINNTYNARNKITKGENMKLYIHKISRNDKMKLDEINKRVDEINDRVTEIVNHLDWVQESYRITIDIDRNLLKNIFETIYPDFFVGLNLPRFGPQKLGLVY